MLFAILTSAACTIGGLYVLRARKVHIIVFPTFATVTIGVIERMFSIAAGRGIQSVDGSLFVSPFLSSVLIVVWFTAVSPSPMTSRQDSRVWSCIGLCCASAGAAMLGCGFASAIDKWNMNAKHYYPMACAGVVLGVFGTQLVLASRTALSAIRRTGLRRRLS